MQVEKNGWSDEYMGRSVARLRQVSGVSRGARGEAVRIIESINRSVKVTESY
jgi:hypothetical protein